jgi:hypothetical protein
VKTTNQPNAQHHPLWLWPNLIGLDAPAVAVAWQLLFSQAFGAHLPIVFHLILALSVWCVYLADRLYDATRAPDTGDKTDRLNFTQKHFATLSGVTVIASLINLLLIIRFVPRHLIVTGLITACFLILYYIIRLKRGSHQTSVIPREILCGMIFGLGTVIAPHAFLPEGNLAQFIIAALLLGLLCSANCVLISVWEKEEDIAGNDNSIATASSRILPYMSKALTALILIASAMAFLGPCSIHLAVTASASALRLLLHFEQHLSNRALRVLTDAVLLSPLPLIIL